MEPNAINGKTKVAGMDVAGQQLLPLMLCCILSIDLAQMAKAALTCSSDFCC